MCSPHYSSGTVATRQRLLNVHFIISTVPLTETHAYSKTNHKSDVMVRRSTADLLRSLELKVQINYHH